MAKFPGLKLERRDVSQTFNLEELLGVSFRGETSLRLAIAQAVIDRIVERTQEENVDREGKRFAGYSEEYEDTTAFQLLKDGSVDMTLTGNMLNSIDVLNHGPNTIQIGFRSQRERDKAYNHNTGDTVPERAFFGLDESEFKSLVDDEFGSDLRRLRGQEPRSRSLDEIFEAAAQTSAINQLSEETFPTTTVATILEGL